MKTAELGHNEGLVTLMKLAMSRQIRKKHKIFNSIVGFFTVNMVDDFFGSKITTNMFLHYKSVFKDITLGIAKRVLPHFNSPVFASFNSARWFSHSLHYNTGKVMGI